VAFDTDNLAKAAMKKLFGKAHTGPPVGEGGTKDLPNESVASSTTVASSTVYGESIPLTPPGASTSAIRVCTSGVEGELDLTEDGSSNGNTYYVTVPTGHDLLSYTNPETGSNYQVDERVQNIIPASFGSGYRPIPKDNGTEIPPTDASDWFLDDKAGTLTSETDLSLSTTGTIACYVYVGDMVSDHIESTSNPHTVTVSQALTADGATDATAAELEELTDGSTTTLHSHSGGAGTPGGSDTQLQYNDGGSFGGLSTLTWDDTDFLLGSATTTKLQFRDPGLYINSSTDGQLDIDADTEVEVTAPTVDIDASTAMTIDTTNLNVTATVAVTGNVSCDELAVGDEEAIKLGNNTDAQMQWENGSTNDSLVLGLGVGSAAQSGFFSIMEKGDIGNSSREPAATTANPTLRVYSADQTQSLDFIQMYHNQTDAFLESGNGDLRLKFTTGEMEIDPNNIIFDADEANDGDLRIDTLTAARTWTLPDITGTIALTADNDSFEVPNGAGGTTVDTAGEVTVDTTSDTFNFHDGTAERVLSPIVSKSITIEDPGSSEDLSMFYADEAMTITKMVAVLVGSSTPSVTWTVRHGADRSAAGAEVVTSGTTTTSVSTGSVVTSFNDATVVDDSFVWLETTAQSGTVDEIHLTVFYRQDA